MWKLATLLLLLALCARSQVVIGVTPLEKPQVESLLGKPAAKVIQVWTATVRNATDEPVVISEGAAVAASASLGMMHSTAANMILAQRVKLSAWSIAGRIVQDLALAASFFGTSGIVTMPDKALVGLSGFNSMGPYILDRLKNRDVNAVANFEGIRWPDLMTLGPGEVAASHLFSIPQYGKSRYNSFEIRLRGSVRLAE